MEETDIQGVVQQALQEFTRQQQAQSEPAYKTELQEERKRREQLERRLNEVIEENKRSRQAAVEAERGSAIRAELQRLGVAKVDLAYKAVQDEIMRTEDGRLVAKVDGSETGIKEYLSGFVTDNPEFLPARISGGSGVTSSQKSAPAIGEQIDLDKIRQEIVRLASQNLK
jgi:hypothetical protein